MTINKNCPCKKEHCVRHGKCELCREHHAKAPGNVPTACESLRAKAPSQVPKGEQQ